MSDILRIGQVAGLTGCSVESIRHYEKLGLLRPPKRSAQGYRYYDQHSVERIGFIRHGRALGLDLHTIQALLNLADNPDADCTAADDIASHHLEQLEQRIEALQALADELRQLVHQCRGGHTRDCRIIQTLFQPTETTNKTGFRESEFEQGLS
ncbi:MAG: MerR family transcriptional regulator [Nitrincola lacisaponensis]|uniref:Transcriptional regulator, MerR family n=1 Tax=Nitrincola lacisaponensis TaxID=267850 RepID=A0A063Y1U4_9GAMM|nr:helix-turn-helix domain-containing protein [Nitrincola lacisaponensis]KDE39130.1 Transcriptional regulator, MerR family [Nitrincola lacisaponensis]